MKFTEIVTNDPPDYDYKEIAALTGLGEFIMEKAKKISGIDLMKDILIYCDSNDSNKCAENIFCIPLFVGSRKLPDDNLVQIARGFLHARGF